ncbi:MAG: MFS transporter [Sphingomonadales bacterium 32-65-25]|uniref:BCD family MFS transporter n=1 Tax=Sandarakinorhabdus limnophila TaxID=210512 RepID=UPI000BD636AD|nr:BCD family MFS transporter [Sandarakinorhabdus limnophila]MCM0032755.1 BCD family MFS transporter [Sandarakinorhabdus limnophila]OYX77338.1 MAG: MFS transporter [Sphingomonadales bacterium 32-65-25]
MASEPTAKGINARLTKVWMTWGAQFLPFADVASPELPLSRLLRLSLIQVSVGMSLVLLVGTLNRVMIVELGVPATLVGVMLALPLLAAPFRALIGHKSDTHKSALGWRRVPYIYIGTMVQFGGLAIMPFALLVLAGAQEAYDERIWLGQPAAALAFLLVGAGIHTTQTVGLALATDLTKPEQQPNVVGLMYVMLLLGSIVASLFFGWALEDFSNGRLIQVIQGSAVVTIFLNFIALWKQEARVPHYMRTEPATPDPTFRQSWDLFVGKEKTLLRLIAVGLGTLAFSMSDIVLEPYGGEVLKLGVGTTTLLSAIMAFGSLMGFAYASYILSLGADPFRMASLGAVIGLPAYGLIIMAAGSDTPELFTLGVLLAGIGTGLFGHGTLTATMRLAPTGQIGIAMGAWGAVQATSQGIGATIGGVMRDAARGLSLGLDVPAAANGYVLIFALELALMAATLAAMWPLLNHDARD